MSEAVLLPATIEPVAIILVETVFGSERTTLESELFVSLDLVESRLREREKDDSERSGQRWSGGEGREGERKGGRTKKVNAFQSPAPCEVSFKRRKPFPRNRSFSKVRNAWR